MFFGQKYNIIPLTERVRVKQHVKTVLKFISQRRREWSLIFFHATHGSNNDATELIAESYNELNVDQKSNFKVLIVLYASRAGFFASLFCRRGRNRAMAQTTNFENLHTFIKQEKAQDPKFTQALLGALPKENMQLYFQERNADTEY